MAPKGRAAPSSLVPAAPADRPSAKLGEVSRRPSLCALLATSRAAAFSQPAHAVVAVPTPSRSLSGLLSASRRAHEDTIRSRDSGPQVRASSSTLVPRTLAPVAGFTRFLLHRAAKGGEADAATCPSASHLRQERPELPAAAETRRERPMSEISRKRPAAAGNASRSFPAFPAARDVTRESIVSVDNEDAGSKRPPPQISRKRPAAAGDTSRNVPAFRAALDATRDSLVSAASQDVESTRPLPPISRKRPAAASSASHGVSAFPAAASAAVADEDEGGKRPFYPISRKRPAAQSSASHGVSAFPAAASAAVADGDEGGKRPVAETCRKRPAASGGLEVARSAEKVEQPEQSRAAAYHSENAREAKRRRENLKAKSFCSGRNFFKEGALQDPVVMSPDNMRSPSPTRAKEAPARSSSCMSPSTISFLESLHTGLTPPKEKSTSAAAKSKKLPCSRAHRKHVGANSAQELPTETMKTTWTPVGLDSFLHAAKARRICQPPPRVSPLLAATNRGSKGSRSTGTAVHELRRALRSLDEANPPAHVRMLQIADDGEAGSDAEFDEAPVASVPRRLDR